MPRATVPSVVSLVTPPIAFLSALARAGQTSLRPVQGVASALVRTGAAVRSAPAPAAVVFGAALAIIVIAIVITAASPETVGKRQGIGDALVSRIGVPSAARTAFARTAPGMI